ncbi:hypothetical protein GCM10011514_41190 [Emticicia aquatilis]|uniref:Uncharacterized protein n=1 Tax=Emticicia aquatilis TaxID=1537369 RepID=A0A916Z1Y4_9BACT|nr:hypothetical protein [Emticicia aquatilis]GGD72857.1 hypothetical protein GCM10011514_41190 [Emticicia aquatilis]
MKKIKSFIYLDNYKMYSIASQIFEGLTEYIISSKSNHTEESNKQEGSKASGLIMADIITESSAQTEKKFLHDYSYTLFENALFQEDKVIELNDSNVETKILEIQSKNFIKVTGRIAVKDVKNIHETLLKMNDLLTATKYLQYQNTYKQEIEKFNEQINTISDRNQKQKVKSIFENKFSFEKIIKDELLDKKFVEHLSLLFSYGYNDMLEVLLPIEKQGNFYLFSCNLDRQMLKEKVDYIVKKYSRETEQEFTIFGILTQSKRYSEELETEDLNHVHRDEDAMKLQMNKVRKALSVMENTFNKKLEYEYIIDPLQFIESYNFTDVKLGLLFKWSF